MHPRIRIVLIGLILISITYTTRSVLHIDRSPNWLLHVVLQISPALAIIIHMFSNFKKNFLSWQKNYNEAEAGSRFRSACLDAPRRTMENKEYRNSVKPFVLEPLHERHSYKMFVGYVFLLAGATLLLSWGMLLSGYFDKD